MKQIQNSLMIDVDHIKWYQSFCIHRIICRRIPSFQYFPDSMKFFTVCGLHNTFMELFIEFYNFIQIFLISRFLHGKDKLLHLFILFFADLSPAHLHCQFLKRRLDQVCFLHLFISHRLYYAAFLCFIYNQPFFFDLPESFS